MIKVQADVQELTKTKADVKTVADVQAIAQKNKEDIADAKHSPKLLIAIFGLVGVCFSTAGSVLAVVITAYFKIGAPTP